MKKVLFLLLLLVVSLAIIPLFLPKSMHVEDEYIFDAPIEMVYLHFNDLTKFTEFDAWSANDPDIKISYSSPAFGEGAYYEWSSRQKNLGDGKMTIQETRMNEFVRYQIQFGEMTGNAAEVILSQIEGDKTRVVWSFDSAEASYPDQVFNFLMKGTVQDNLHKGLVNLDSILLKQVQKSPAISPNTIRIVEQPENKLFGILQSSTTDAEEIKMAISETFGLVYSYLHDAKGLSPEQIGAPAVYWKQYNEETGNALFYVGYFMTSEVALEGEFEYAEVPKGNYLSTQHLGTYEDLIKTYSRLYEYGDDQNLELSKEIVDVYQGETDLTQNTNLKTQIYIPVVD